jgi:hypothetical protein
MYKSMISASTWCPDRNSAPAHDFPELLLEAELCSVPLVASATRTPVASPAASGAGVTSPPHHARELAYRHMQRFRRLPRWPALARMIDKNSKLGAARFGHRTPGTVPGLPHPPPSRAPRGGANDETQAPTWRRHPSFDPSFDCQPRDDRECAPRGPGASNHRLTGPATSARPA